MLASAVQMASLQHLPASLLLGRSGAAARRDQSRDRHFARVFATTVVNAAAAGRVCLLHRMALCSAHGYAGFIASPGGGPLPFWARSTARARMNSGSSSGCSGVGAAVAMACGHLSFLARARTAVAVLSLMGLTCGICRALLHWSIGSGHGGASQKGGY